MVLLTASRNRINNQLADDLTDVVTCAYPVWETLRGQRLFITGGTGFFGRWFLQSLVLANQKLKLDASAVVLTRNPGAFRIDMPHLAADPAIKLCAGDVRDFEFPQGKFSHIIHAAATSARATFNHEDPLVKFDTLVAGTRRVLDFAVACGAEKFLYTSSGAVYGKQPADMTHIPEAYPGAPHPANPQSAWGEAKRAAEFLCGYYALHYGLETKIARCFSFVGPYLPLDIHYAIGNFIRDGLNGGPIMVNGDGTPCRAYLYAADWVIWLLTVLAKAPAAEVYNVGSDEAISIKNLADTVSSCFSHKPAVVVRQSPSPGALPNRYVPDVSKAKSELGLTVRVGLVSAIRKTINFYVTNHTMGA